MTNFKFKHSDQSGRSMIEMLGVLAIVGVLSIGGITGYSKAMQRFNVSKTIDQVQYIVSNVRSLYAARPSYAGLDTAAAIAAGIFPTDMMFGAANVRHAFNGEVTVAPVQVDGQSDRGFGIVFQNLTRQVCAELAVSDFGTSDRGAGYMGVSIDGTNTPAFTAAKTWGFVEVGGLTPVGGFSLLTPSQALTDCSGAANAIRWIFI